MYPYTASLQTTFTIFYLLRNKTPYGKSYPILLALFKPDQLRLTKHLRLESDNIEETFIDELLTMY